MTAPACHAARSLLSACLVLGVTATALFAAETPTTTLFKPQGSGSATANGDFISSTGGTDSPYSIYLEVTPDLATLNVDIFDADIGAGGTGGGSSEEGGLDGRDRQFGGSWNTDVTYSLFDPGGSLVKSITCNVAATCDGQAADAAWIDFYDSVTPTDYFLTDNSSYAASSGTVSWNGNWTEVNDDGNPGTGTIQIIGGQIRFTSAGLPGSNPTSNDIIYRDFNLASIATSNATLQFDFGTQFYGPSSVAVDICQTGNTNCVTVSTITGGVASPVVVPFTPATVPFTASNRIRFRVVTLDSFSFFGFAIPRYFQFDNVRITGDNGGVPIAPAPGHWEFRVDMSSGVTGGDDLNAFGLRVPGVNAYADTTFAFGTTDGNNPSMTLHPWVTSGCKCKANDFDADLAGTLTMTAADGTSFGGPFAFSGNDAWNTNEIGFTSGNAPTGGWTDADESDGYGIWTMDATSPSSGSSVSNYTVYFVGNETSTSAGTTPPTGPAPSGSFRLYLPDDGGSGAPDKPYLEQFLTYVTSSTGSNPPLPGETSRYEVTVRLTNPTAYDITSATGAATVPAGATFVAITGFEGNSASHAAGTVSWDIGTVAAGDEVLLAYRIDVSGNSLPQNATGTVTSGGTTASYVDETGNGAQARANITLGPICELSVRTALATPAVIASVEAIDEAVGTTLLVTTASETGATGFDILRSGDSAWRRVNDATIPALFANGAGGRYAIPLPDEQESGIFAIDEHTVDGRLVRHGPFRVVPRARRLDDPPAGELGAKPHLRPSRHPDLDESLRSGQESASARVGRHAIVEPRREGLHSILAPRIGAVLGLPLASVEARIRNGGFRLTRRGIEIPWTAAADSSAILFWAEAPDSIYSGVAAYRLEPAPGRTMPVRPVTEAPTSKGTFLHEEHVERDLFAATVLPLDAEGDYWFWKSLVVFPGFDQAELGFVADGVDGSSEAEIAIHLQSWADTAHRAVARVNGVAVGELRWSGITTATLHGSIPPGTLRDGGNTVAIEARKAATGPTGFYVDSFDLSYRRSFRAQTGRLLFEGDGPTTVEWLVSPSVVLLDVTDPREPVLLSGGRIEPGPANSWALSFVSQPDTRYAAWSSTAVTSAGVRAAREQGLASPSHRADYLIVTSEKLRDASDRYADYRRSTGFETMVVDVEAIWDELNHGEPDPRALRRFLASTASWQLRPRFVLLIGDGSYDYRNLLGDPPLVPPFMVTTRSGIFASDARYADWDDDGLPDVALGRLPVSSGTELLGYLEKIERYERDASPVPSLFAADDRDGDTDFAEASRRLSSARTSTDLVLAPGATGVARERLFREWDDRLSLMNWTGHGGLDRLASEGLLTTADIPRLDETLPVLVALSCTINRFELPLFDSLGKSLVKTPEGGALAVWAPTGLALHGRSFDAGSELHRELTGGATLGEASRRALAVGGAASTSDLYVLLGDPAISLRLLPAPSIPGEGE